MLLHVGAIIGKGSQEECAAYRVPIHCSRCRHASRHHTQRTVQSLHRAARFKQRSITGEVVYQTNPETGPPGTHGPACGCDACLEAIAAAKGIAWSAAE